MSKYFNTYGYDIDKEKIKNLKNRLDQNNEIKQINKKLKFSYNEKIF